MEKPLFVGAMRPLPSLNGPLVCFGQEKPREVLHALNLDDAPLEPPSRRRDQVPHWILVHLTLCLPDQHPVRASTCLSRSQVETEVATETPDTCISGALLDPASYPLRWYNAGESSSAIP